MSIKINRFEYFTSKQNESFILSDLETKYGVEIDLWDNGSYLELSKIYVPKNNRNEGLGTSIMTEITEYADKHNKIIRLTPSTDFGGTSIIRLMNFYSKFGFVKNKDLKYKDSMVRFPK